MLAILINTHALDDAQAGKWGSVAAILNALTTTVRPGKVGGKASLTALVQNGIDPNEVIAAMRSVPMASELLNTLTADGVDWADDMTAYVMSGLVAAGKIKQQTADVMRSLSEREESVIVTTAESCELAWIALQKSQALERVTNAAAEAAREEYRKSDSTPESIVAAAVALLGAI